MKLSTIKVQIQKPVYTATFERSIAMLILPHAELATNIEQELQNNPLLEAEFNTSSSDNPQETQEIPIDLEKMNALINLSSSNMARTTIEDDGEFESVSITSMMTLEDHLYQQLFWEISDPLKRKIGNFIIGNLDKDGFLHLAIKDMAEAMGITDTSLIEEVLNTIHNFDPIGIAAKDLRECLIIQLKSRLSPYSGLAIQIVESHLEDLGNKRYALLAKKHSATLDEITAAEGLIASLEPKPARNYRPNEPSIYAEPDLYVRKNEKGEYVIETNKKGLPTLRISQTYRNLLNQTNLSIDDRNFIKEKITHAVNFIRNLEQRGETLTAIARYILKRQKDFFEGENSDLTPMTLKDAADHLERCESTISRAISNKYIDTPQGLFPLKFFFSHNVSRQDHENVSAHNVKQELEQLIEDENKHSPLSDQDIQAYFKTKGLHLARRTITKYRQVLEIPASHLRKVATAANVLQKESLN